MKIPDLPMCNDFTLYIRLMYPSVCILYKVQFTIDRFKVGADENFKAGLALLAHGLDDDNNKITAATVEQVFQSTHKRTTWETSEVINRHNNKTYERFYMATERETRFDNVLEQQVKRTI